MRCMHAITAFTGICVLCLSSGCVELSHDSGWHVRSPEYEIGFANRSSLFLTEVTAEWDDGAKKRALDVGKLRQGSIATVSDAPDPIPTTATALWTTPEGKIHRQNVVVAKKIQDIATWTGTIWFKFTDDGVEVVPLSKKQMDDLADAHREYP